MREFFLDLLQNIDKLSGLKQYEKLCQMKDYKSEINTLLDILCRVSDQFPFIPDQDKKNIINNAVITDGDFIGLNARIIYKWLNLKKDMFFTEMAHREAANIEEPLTGEAKEARLKEWLEAVNKMDMVKTEKSDPYKTIREQWKSKDGEVYKSSVTAADVIQKDLHLQYIKENYDPRTGDKLECWIEEERWIELQNL